MPGLKVYISDNLTMPNGQILYAEDVPLEVTYGCFARWEQMYSPRRDWDWDVTVDAVDPFWAVDDNGNHVLLHLSPDHPAIVDLIKRRYDDIEDDCRCFDGEYEGWAA